MKDLTKIEEILLLTIWRLKQDAYGVKIRNYVSEIIGKDFSYGHLYDALAQLNKKEFVSVNLADSLPNERGRRKKIYNVTEEGFKALENSRAVNNIIWDGVPQLTTIWKGK